MTIIIDPYTIPDKGVVDIEVKRSFEIKITAQKARRQVDRWLLDEVSYLLGAEKPTLLIGEQVVWQVPVWISFPHTGRVSQVGTINVDVTTGEMNNTLSHKTKIEQIAQTVAQNQPPFQLREAPTAYLAQDVPAAPKVEIHDDGIMTSYAMTLKSTHFKDVYFLTPPQYKQRGE